MDINGESAEELIVAFCIVFKNFICNNFYSFLRLFCPFYLFYRFCILLIYLLSRRLYSFYYLFFSSVFCAAAMFSFDSLLTSHTSFIIFSATYISSSASFIFLSTIPYYRTNIFVGMKSCILGYIRFFTYHVCQLRQFACIARHIFRHGLQQLYLV